MNTINRFTAFFMLMFCGTLLSSSQTRLYADVNGDGEVNIADVNAVINVILGGVAPSQQHNYVDLGLPSGTLWATCNVGANAPEEYGDYFAWGETMPKNCYNDSTYLWSKSDNNSSGYTKYCLQSNYGYAGFSDGKFELDPIDDAASANWGSEWRMPSLAQLMELCEKCTWTWTTQNDVYGQLGTGPNGNTIFLPATGSRFNESLNYVGTIGNYWTRTLRTDYSSYAYNLYLNFSFLDIFLIKERHSGLAVRAVRVS